MWIEVRPDLFVNIMRANSVEFSTNGSVETSDNHYTVTVKFDNTTHYLNCRKDQGELIQKYLKSTLYDV